MNSDLWQDKKVLVTGGTGFIGRNLVALLRQLGPRALWTPTHGEFDLTQGADVQRLFAQHRPDVVFHLAGLVGGILANKRRPAEFYYQNLLMDAQVLHHAAMSGVSKFVAAAAGCGYPADAEMPVKETNLWNGLPQKESAPFSSAKRMLCMQSAAYHAQYGFPAVVCLIGGIYGPWDNFRLAEAHVVPALVAKFVAAQVSHEPVEVWGTGRSTRDFIYASDVARGLLLAAERYDTANVVNLSSGVETPIAELVLHLQALTNPVGGIRWLADKPEGQLRRCLDVAKARAELGFRCEVDIRAGLAMTVNWYKENLSNPDIRR
jgi:GDP-L-fucose synthase